ncbi:IS3 family transposase [Streptomyces sp. NPDC058240]|uniref:IS3 family transposase n=1 Tax=Streptomyces sp. NPDC058240 TaxID=3346396 RepID=UPI0036E6B260
MSEVYAFIEAEKTTHGVAFLCRLLKVARSSFYAWLAAGKNRALRQAAEEALAHEITVIHLASRKTYGVPRIHAELRRLGRYVNRKRIARLMRDRGIQGAHRRKRRSLTRPDKKARPAPDLIGRDFHASVPGTRLVGTSPSCPPPRAGSISPAGSTWLPARWSATPWPTTTAPPRSSTR